MVDYPQVPRRFVTTDQVQSRISGQDVALPFNEVAGALDMGGQILTRKADQLKAATDTRVLATQSQETRDAAQRMMIEANGDPEKFQASWTAYMKQRQSSEFLDPAMRAQVEADQITTGSATHRGIVGAEFERGIKESAATITTEIGALDDQAAAMARDGKTGTPEFAAITAKIDGFYGQMAGNPAFGVAADVVTRARERQHSAYAAEAVIGHVVATATNPEGGMAAAKAEADKLLTDPSLLLSPAERRQYHGIAMGQLTTMNAERTAQLAALKPQATELQNRLKADARLVPDAEVDSMVDKLSALGGAADAMDLINARARAKFLPAYDQLTPAGRVQAYGEAAAGGSPAGAPAPPAAVAFINERTRARFSVEGSDKLNPVFATRLATAIQAAEAATGEKAVITEGYRSNETQAQYRANYIGQPVVWGGKTYTPERKGGRAAPPGTGRHPHGEAADISSGKVLNWLHQHAGEYGLSFLKGAAFNDDPVHIQLAGGPASGPTSDPGGGVGSPVDYNPSTDPDTINAMRTQVTADFSANLETMTAGLKNLMSPSADDLQTLVNEASIINDDSTRQKLTTFLESAQAGNLFENVTPDQRHAMLEQLKSGTDGLGRDGYTVAEQRYISAVEDISKAYDDREANDPLGLLATLGRGAPMPLNFADPNALAQGFVDRQADAMVAEQRFNRTGLGVFRPAEAQQVGQQMGGAPAAVLSSLAALDDAHLFATLAQDPIKDAVSRLALSQDPAKYSAAMQFLDQAWRRDGSQTFKIFGNDITDRLQDWQAGLQDATPQEIAENLRMQADPQVRARRKVLLDEGATEARKVKDGDILGAFDTNGLLPGGGPGVPQGPAYEAFRADFEGIYARRYSVSGNKDLAMQQTMRRMSVANVWGPSDLANGELTHYPPEANYPKIDGSSEWMKTQAIADLKAAGVDVGVAVPGKPPEDERQRASMSAADYAKWQADNTKPTGENLDNVRFVADQQTDAEIASGKAPSYMIQTVNPETQEWHAVISNEGRIMRMGWDAEAAQSAVTADAIANDRRGRGNMFPPAPAEGPAPSAVIQPDAPAAVSAAPPPPDAAPGVQPDPAVVPAPPANAATAPVPQESLPLRQPEAVASTVAPTIAQSVPALVAAASKPEATPAAIAELAQASVAPVAQELGIPAEAMPAPATEMAQAAAAQVVDAVKAGTVQPDDVPMQIATALAQAMSPQPAPVPGPPSPPPVPAAPGAAPVPGVASPPPTPQPGPPAEPSQSSQQVVAAFEDAPAMAAEPSPAPAASPASVPPPPPVTPQLAPEPAAPLPGPRQTTPVEAKATGAQIAVAALIMARGDAVEADPASPEFVAQVGEQIAAAMNVSPETAPALVQALVPAVTEQVAATAQHETVSPLETARVAGQKMAAAIQAADPSTYAVAQPAPQPPPPPVSQQASPTPALQPPAPVAEANANPPAEPATTGRQTRVMTQWLDSKAPPKFADLPIDQQHAISFDLKNRDDVESEQDIVDKQHASIQFFAGGSARPLWANETAPPAFTSLPANQQDAIHRSATAHGYTDEAMTGVFWDLIQYAFGLDGRYGDGPEGRP